MTPLVTDYVRVDQRAEALGCNVPAAFTILPENFESAAARKEFQHRSEAATIRTLFRNNQLPLEDLLPRGEKAPYVSTKSFEWAAPIIFVSAGLISSNPNLVSVALGVITNYLYDFFRGKPGPKQVKFEIVVEKADRTCKKKLRGGY